MITLEARQPLELKRSSAHVLVIITLMVHGKQMGQHICVVGLPT